MRAHPYAFAVALGTVMLAAGFGTAITVSTTSYSHFFGDVTNIATGLTISSQKIGVVKTTAAATGAVQGSAVEMATGAAGSANTAVTRAHWSYVAVVEESAVASITSGTYKVELFSDETSQGSLYMTQGTSNGAATEGVTFTWDVGTDLPTGDTSYKIIITQVA